MTLDVGRWTLNVGYWILSSELGQPHRDAPTAYCTLDTGCLTLDIYKKSPATIFIAAGLFNMATPRGFESLRVMAEQPLNTDV